MVVGGLVLVALATVLGGIALAVMGQEISAAVIALGSAAIGALAGLLAPSPAR
jgi:Zn-dependent protease